MALRGFCCGFEFDFQIPKDDGNNQNTKTTDATSCLISCCGWRCFLFTVIFFLHSRPELLHQPQAVPERRLLHQHRWGQLYVRLPPRLHRQRLRGQNQRVRQQPLQERRQLQRKSATGSMQPNLLFLTSNSDCLGNNSQLYQSLTCTAG